MVGWTVGAAANTELALAGWKDASHGLESFGCEPSDVIVHHDRDPVFTSYGWTGKVLIDDGSRLSYALGGASDNPEMESFFGRFKVENRSLLTDAETLTDLVAVVDDRIAYYNDAHVARARSSFLRARQHDSTRNAANHWITHLDTEGNATTS